MKYRKTLIELGRAMVAGFCIAAVSIPHTGPACVGSAGPICNINPGACLKSMVLTKSVPGPVFPIPPAGMGTLLVTASLFITCPLTNNCGIACPGAGVPVAASLSMTLMPPAPPLCPAGSPSPSAMISTAAGTMTMPVCSAAGTFNGYTVPVGIPGGTCPGLYTVVGTATVTFSDGMVLTQTGDTVVCLVEPAPGLPGVPRLSVELITPSFPRMAPGDQHVATYRVINNDPSNSVTLTAFATSKQGAVRPQGGNEAQGVFAISSPFGDDFPIQFNPGTGCIPLPDHPYTQPTISMPLPVLGPRQTNTVRVGIRSYGQCASGSCSESTMRVQGTFADGSPAFGCAGMAFYADISQPSQNCGNQVNDCNHNGIPDALDISSRRSQDANFNALPDECEQFINVPFFASVAPNNPQPGAPIHVQVAFNEVIPISNVWANGSSLIRTQFFGAPLWVGTIPADTRPGPQTVYFLGKDSQGGLSSYIAPYQVQAPPRVSRIFTDNNGNVVLQWDCQDCHLLRTDSLHSDPDDNDWSVVTDRGETSYVVPNPQGQGFFTMCSALFTNSVNCGSTFRLDGPEENECISYSINMQDHCTTMDSFIERSSSDTNRIDSWRVADGGGRGKTIMLYRGEFITFRCNGTVGSCTVTYATK